MSAAHIAERYVNRPSGKERVLAHVLRRCDDSFLPLCEHLTAAQCAARGGGGRACTRVHLRPIIRANTDLALGNCRYLNSCHRGATCHYVHYEVDVRAFEAAHPEPRAYAAHVLPAERLVQSGLAAWVKDGVVARPAQWINCDLRTFDLAALGKFDVVLLDPPWDIHMSLPYGTMSDADLYALDVPVLQDEGVLFLWITGRAMELGRALLQHWGYYCIDELLWLKVGQTQRQIRTGRTGHWLNHTKEHCLVGVKRARGDARPPTLPPGARVPLPRWVHCGLGNDVIVSHVRRTSQKPDELYAMIERMCPGARKVELFGRRHNIRRDWLTLGNQLHDTHVAEAQLRAACAGSARARGIT